MNQAIFKSSLKTGKKVSTVIFGQQVFWTLVLGVILSILAYVYFVNAIVWNVASRQQAERQLSDMNASIASLEANYMTLTSAVSIDNAYGLGFQNTTSDQQKFVKRSASLGVLPTHQVQ